MRRGHSTVVNQNDSAGHVSPPTARRSRCILYIHIRIYLCIRISTPVGQHPTGYRACGTLVFTTTTVQRLLLCAALVETRLWRRRQRRPETTDEGHDNNIIISCPPLHIAGWTSIRGPLDLLAGRCDGCLLLSSEKPLKLIISLMRLLLLSSLRPWRVLGFPQHEDHRGSAWLEPHVTRLCYFQLLDLIWKQ